MVSLALDVTSHVSTRLDVCSCLPPVLCAVRCKSMILQLRAPSRPGPARPPRLSGSPTLFSSAGCAVAAGGAGPVLAALAWDACELSFCGGSPRCGRH